MPTINMRSAADTVKGQGVGACYEEQVDLVKKGLQPNFKVFVNSLRTCDIMHYHTVNLGYYFEILFRGRKSVNVGYVHFLPDTLDDSLRLNKLFRFVFYKYLICFYNSMDYLVTVNPCVIEKIKKYNLKRPRVLCIPNFVSEDNFYPIDKINVDSLRNKFDLPLDKFIVLGVGQLQTRKGIFDFVETAKKTPDAHFVWAGCFSFGKMSDGYNEIQKLIADPPENLTFLGMIERENMNELYNACDIMFLPSFDELFPMAILEALACRMPVLLRDIEVYKDILFEHYLKALDPDGFSKEIIRVSSDASEYNKWSEQAWLCHKKYDKNRTLKLWESFYASIYEEARAKEAVLREGTL